MVRELFRTSIFAPLAIEGARNMLVVPDARVIAAPDSMVKGAWISTVPVLVSVLPEAMVIGSAMVSVAPAATFMFVLLATSNGRLILCDPVWTVTCAAADPAA